MEPNIDALQHIYYTIDIQEISTYLQNYEGITTVLHLTSPTPDEYENIRERSNGQLVHIHVRLLQLFQQWYYEEYYMKEHLPIEEYFTEERWENFMCNTVPNEMNSPTQLHQDLSTPSPISYGTTSAIGETTNSLNPYFGRNTTTEYNTTTNIVLDNPPTVCTHDVSSDNEDMIHPQEEMATGDRLIVSALVDQTMVIDNNNHANSSTSKLTSSRLIDASEEATIIEKNAVADEEMDAIDFLQDQSANSQETVTAVISGSTSTSTSEICTTSTSTTRIGEVVLLQEQPVSSVSCNINTVNLYAVMYAKIGSRTSMRKYYGIDFPWDRGRNSDLGENVQASRYVTRST